jgi:preprotein translocase subunit SecF
VARGKKRKQQRKPTSQVRQAPPKPPVGARAKTLAAERIPAAPEVSDIPWTAEKPQPVRRAFGVFRVGKINFVGNQKVFVYLSGALLLLSVLSLLVRGLNYGIDFTGGNKYTFKFSQAIEEAVLRQELEGLGVAGSLITVFSERPNEAMVRTPYLDTASEARVQTELKAKYPGLQVTDPETVEPTIGGELLRNALIATLLGCLGILVYVAIRFEYRFATAGVLALVHDSLITVGVFSLLQLEVNSAFVAAILTIIGYSINDTIVVFDRIRDNLKRRGKEGLDGLANRSINETFVRSINTSMTAFLAITAIFLFGGATTRDFSLALMVGIFVGTYSSICVATPVWLAWRKRDERLRAASGGKTLTPKTSRG